jgi:hypothetical protein
MRKIILLTTSIVFLASAAALAADAPKADGNSSAIPGTVSAAAATAPRAYTMEALYQNSADLIAKKVVVRGRAVKVTAGIQGKIWTHLQDGTGDKDQGTNDIICVSAKDSPEVGSVVTFTGSVKLNTGSIHKIILEDATIIRQ